MLSLNSGRFCSFSTPYVEVESNRNAETHSAILVSCRMAKAYVNREVDKWDNAVAHAVYFEV